MGSVHFFISFIAIFQISLCFFKTLIPPILVEPQKTYISLSSFLSLSNSSIVFPIQQLDPQKCCEELVAAGAINTLLRLIRSVSRSIPDQEVLKHGLSTLRNLARYPHIVEVLIQSHGSVQTIVLELLRNKEDGYFIASELLQKIFSTHTGVEAILKSSALLKRLHNLVEELTRKANYEKRNARGPSPVKTKR